MPRIGTADVSGCTFAVYRQVAGPRHPVSRLRCRGSVFAPPGSLPLGNHTVVIPATACGWLEPSRIVTSVHFRYQKYRIWTPVCDAYHMHGAGFVAGLRMSGWPVGPVGNGCLVI